MLVSFRRISMSGVRLENFAASIAENGAMASRRPTAASVISESKATSQRCGRSMVGGVGGIRDWV